MHLAFLCVIFFASSVYAQIASDFPAKVIVQAASQSTKSNVIVSPYSLLAPLGTLSLAAVYSTRSELLDLLGAENKTELVKAYEDIQEKLSKLESIELVSANKIFIAEDLKINHRFNTLVRKIFDVEVENVDFYNATETKAKVVQWIRNATHDNIIYWRFKPYYWYEAVIANAVYLNAPWSTNFTLIGRKEFHVNEKKIVDVKFMTNLFMTYHTYTEDLHAEVLKIPYEDNDCSMIVVVPYVMNSIEGILKSLAYNGNALNEVLDTQMSFKTVNLTMPLFDTLSTIDLKELLLNLGVKKIFEEAQLNNLLEDGGILKVHEGYQKIVMSVNIDGTRASSATVPVVQSPIFGDTFSYILPQVDVLVDKPFYFEVRCADITIINGVIRNPMTVLKYD